MSTKHALYCLVHDGFVKSGDVFQFKFKDHEFSSIITHGGILKECTWNGDRVFSERDGFITLTDWTDSCIQECAEEFVTRFSSWRRVRHAATGRPLYCIRDEMWKSRKRKRSEDVETIESVKVDLIAERRKVAYLESRVRDLEGRTLASKRQCVLDSEERNPFLMFGRKGS